MHVAIENSITFLATIGRLTMTDMDLDEGKSETPDDGPDFQVYQIFDGCAPGMQRRRD